MMKHRTRQRRYGFTIIELVVSMTIVGVLAGLILPAVQRVREIARRTQCLSNVRTLSQSVFLFEETNGGLPPSELADGWASGFVLTLPYLDQSAAFDLWVEEQPYYSQTEFKDIQPQTFLCPTRTDETSNGDFRFFFPNGFVTGPSGIGHYAMLRSHSVFSDSGSFRTAAPVRPATAQPSLGFTLGATLNGWASTVRMADIIPDGASNTLWFAESARVPEILQTSVYNGDRRFGYSRLGGPAFPVVGDDEPVAPLNNRRLGSAHAGVFACGFADGSVKFRSKGIDGSLLQRLVELSGGHWE